MAQRPKAKPKRKSPKNTDKKQSERFKEAARTFNADEGSAEFAKAFRKIAPPKKRA